ncbi:cysteine--tRNA ligase, mitochondrial [Phlebotomus argentipes]|uniref:cysteine--tRNA ligase, mitochondrial n=1 Tax=Phlebotomus argentipes TaxID=94469 RepID=UPI002892A835|nr:cysteine--tRNA ligase, mitochondrial [Phlebotomus argentipes]
MKWITPKDGFSTGIEVFNCIAKEKVPLILRRKHLATLYTCGPTVYDDTHIGHASTYVKLDTIRRILNKHFGVRVFSVMNITDIDDKIIRRSQEMRCSWEAVARENEEKFWRDLRALGVVQPHVKMRVSENIEEIVKFISRLEKKGLAYEATDNSVYFKLKDYRGYGKLQKLSQEADKNADFALWKAAKEGEPFWESPWGPGRPGWHIECSAMASKILGSTIDIHAGGIDLRFPHHENEEAQSCAYHGCERWVNYWLHTGHLKLSGDAQKMSKSLKNTISVEELLSKHSPDHFRMLCLLTNYRREMVFSEEAMQMARKVLQRFQNFLQEMEVILSGSRQINDFNQQDIFEKYSKATEDVDQHLKDDFNMASALQTLQEFISFVSKAINSAPKDGRSSPEIGILQLSKEFVEDTLSNMGFSLPGSSADAHSESSEDAVMEKILEIRQRLRKDRNFSAADVIRDGLREAGLEIKDHGEKSSWSRRR